MCKFRGISSNKLTNKTNVNRTFVKYNKTSHILNTLGMQLVSQLKIKPFSQPDSGIMLALASYRSDAVMMFMAFLWV